MLTPKAERHFWNGLAEALDPTPDPYYNDPVAWCSSRLSFRPYFYQEDALRELATNHRCSVRGPHGLGKTGMAAVAVLWFADTREKAGKDWKVVTTASNWRQLKKYLWPEIQKWGRKLGYSRTQLLKMELNLSYGSAFPVASDDPANIEGAHAAEILYVIDEGKNVPDETWDAIEGALSTGNAFALAISTPGAPVGRFWQIQTRKPGTTDWKVIHVTKDMAIEAGAMNGAWAEMRRLQWGEDDPRYKNRVLGEFATIDESVVIQLEWVEAANERWLEWQEALESKERSLPPFEVLSVDVARLGSDKSVLAYRHGWFVDELEVIDENTTDQLTARVVNILAGHGGRAVIDVIGVGAGVVDFARKAGCVVDAFNSSSRTDLLDISGELGFINRRAAAWWGLRELLDPARGVPVALPPDDELTGDLTAPKWWEVPGGGRIQVEPKEDVKKRIGRSPDRGDAVVMAFAIEEGEPDNEEGVYIENYEEMGYVSPY